ncbi:MAG: leucine-rich repeat domain-containing protein, partial [Muribaculaceae bacterium]|nr:leucine-rich repeat domain-containing protein [Muribaculaceae bacterium]
YYTINFENKEGGQGIKAQTIDVPEECVWRNVQMSWFQQQVKNQWGSLVGNTEVRPIVYRENSEIKFQLTDIPEKTQPVVSVMMKVMTKSGPEPVYEERETILEGDNGIYTLPALQGDCWVRISGVKTYEEGDPIPAGALTDMNKEDVVGFTELTVTGEMGADEFETIRENFEGIETLDLSQIENVIIPEGAFAGMENLSSVTIPPTVTEIGAGAFAGCENIGTITLPGVSSIGEGAFEGCSSLTSILIPSADGSASPASAPHKIGRSGSGITAESFRGLNPNCLIYVGATDIHDSEDLNIILNQNGNRVAASDIHIDGNYPFNAPASFNLGSHKISFTAHVTGSDACDVDGGWMTIMLPFQPT